MSESLSTLRFEDPPVASADHPLSKHERVVWIPTGIQRRRRLFQSLAEQLDFPEYFGWNWDAVEECLRDLSWLEAPPNRQSAILIAHRDVPFRAGSFNRRTYLKLLVDIGTNREASLIQIRPVFPPESRPIIELELAAVLENESSNRTDSFDGR